MSNTFPAIAVILIPIMLLKTACDSQPAAAPLRTTRMTIGSKSFTLEIADSDASREHGLMQRDSMADDHGMIFVFDQDAQRSFWMKNTRIGLDIIYIDSAGRIVSISTMKPYDLRPVPSRGAAKYAVELNAGAAQQTGVKSGDRIEIPAEAREPRN